LFEVSEVEFLGFQLSKKGLSMQNGKVDSILQFKEPKNVKSLQRFLGLCNFYRAFIKQYSDKARPLFDLIKKENEFIW
jgi:hypothetical protein